MNKEVIRLLILCFVPGRMKAIRRIKLVPKWLAGGAN